MLNQQQITGYIQWAKQKGLTNAQIQAELNRFNTQKQGTSNNVPQPMQQQQPTQPGSVRSIQPNVATETSGYTPLTTNPKTGTPMTVEHYRKARMRASAVGDWDAVKIIDAQLKTESENYNEWLEQQKQEKEEVEPVKLTGTAFADMNLARGVIDTSRIAQTTQKPQYTGSIDAALGAFRIKFGGKGAKEEVKFRQDIAAVRTAIRSYMSGKQVTPTEAKEFEDLIPELTDTDAEVEAKLQGLEKKMIREVGYILKSTGSEVSPENYLNLEELPAKKESDKETFKNKVVDLIESKDRNLVLDLIVGGPLDYINDAVKGFSLKGKEGDNLFSAFGDNIDVAHEAIEKMAQTKDPEEKKRLELFATRILDDVAKESGTIGESFSNRVGWNPMLRGFEVASDITGLAGIPDVIKGGLKKFGVKTLAKEAGEEITETGIKTLAGATSKKSDLVGKVVQTVEKIKSKLPKSLVGSERARQAAKVGKLPELGTKLFDGVSDLARTDRRIAKELYASIDDLAEVQDIPTLLREMSKWGRSAYKVGGDIKANKLSELYDGFYKAGLNILKEEAPDVYKYQRLLGYTIKHMPKNVGSILWKLTLGKIVLTNFSK